MWPGTCHRNSIGLNDADVSRDWYRVEVIGCESGIGLVDRFRDRNHVLDGCVRDGTMPLAVFHVSELLKNIRDRKPSKVRRIRLASAVDKVTLPTRVVRALLP